MHVACMIGVVVYATLIVLLLLSPPSAVLCEWFIRSGLAKKAILYLWDCITY